jgi:hypothetical protein
MRTAPRLALAAIALAFAVAPVAPASASTCSPEGQFVCDTVAPVCQRLASHDTLHRLLCEFG